jgi:hypothetical protein
VAAATPEQGVAVQPPQRPWVARETPLKVVRPPLKRPRVAASHPRGGRSHLWGWFERHPFHQRVAATPLGLFFPFFLKYILILIFFINYYREHFGL